MTDNKITITAPLEIRESGKLYATLITEGRVSQDRPNQDRPELMLAGAVEWASTGIAIRAAHLQDEGSVIAFPFRKGAEIRVNVNPSPELREAVEAGKRFMSVEFHALEESTTPSGVREIERAMLTGAAVVSSPSYRQTKAEIRAREQLLPAEYLLYL
ncbi:MAG: hypothetical protein F4Y61_02905 [Rhodothermaceae bacterium]|nr:hypothetical protein [Rhodothermaceae bacterium]MYF79848.1 hypothetical protein [Chloroflexota bacterium]